MPPGEAFMFRERSTSSKALAKILVMQKTRKMVKSGVVFPSFQTLIKNILITEENYLWAIYVMVLQELMDPQHVIRISVKVIGPVKIWWLPEF